MNFKEILHKFRTESFTEKEKGTKFERLMRSWLLTDPRYNELESVWLWEDFPGRNDFGGNDTGIDLVAKTELGDYWAIQCKCYAENTIIDKPAVDSFLATSSRTFTNEVKYSFDIRLVAATNENLEKAIGEGRFREDLFHRLNEFTLRIPTLAECREDILPLAYFFLKLTCAKAHKSFRGFDRLAEAALLEYPWPGNIRELKNVIGRAVLICQEQWISVSDLNLEISLPKEEETQWTEEEKEKALLLQTLEKTGDNRSKAARLLNVSRTTLYEKLRKYHIID